MWIPQGSSPTRGAFGRHPSPCRRPNAFAGRCRVRPLRASESVSPSALAVCASNRAQRTVPPQSSCVLFVLIILSSQGNLGTNSQTQPFRTLQPAPYHASRVNRGSRAHPRTHWRTVDETQGERTGVLSATGLPGLCSERAVSARVTPAREHVRHAVGRVHRLGVPSKARASGQPEPSALPLPTVLGCRVCYNGNLRRIPRTVEYIHSHWHSRR